MCVTVGVTAFLCATALCVLQPLNAIQPVCIPSKSKRLYVVGMVFALYSADLGSTPGIATGSVEQPGEIPERRASSNP